MGGSDVGRSDLVMILPFRIPYRNLGLRSGGVEVLIENLGLRLGRVGCLRPTFDIPEFLQKFQVSGLGGSGVKRSDFPILESL